MQHRTPPPSVTPDLISLLAVGSGIVGILATLVFKMPGWFLILGLGLVFVGIAWYANDRFQSELRRAANGVMQSARADEERPEAKLRRELTRLKYEPGKSAAAEDLIFALVHLEDAYGEFSRRLASRLDPEEMTYGRYASAGAEVKLAAVRGLAEGAAFVASGASAAPSRIAANQSTLRLPGASAPTGASLAGYLERNHRAVHGLKKMSEALLGMRGTAGQPSHDLERALEELRELAARAKKY